MQCLKKEKPLDYTTAVVDKEIADARDDLKEREDSRKNTAKELASHEVHPPPPRPPSPPAPPLPSPGLSCAPSLPRRDRDFLHPLPTRTRVAGYQPLSSATPP